MQYIRTKAPISGIVTERQESGPEARARCLAAASFKVVEGHRYEGQLPVSSFLTDDLGRFHLELPVGTYSIVEEDRPEQFTPKKSTGTERWDNDCLKKRWQKPLLLLEVKSTATQDIRLQIDVPHEHPCLKTTAHGH